MMLQELSRAGPSMYFGELALLRGEPRSVSVKAFTPVDVLMLLRTDFDSILGTLQSLLEAKASTYAAAQAALKKVMLVPTCSY